MHKCNLCKLVLGQDNMNSGMSGKGHPPGWGLHSY